MKVNSCLAYIDQKPTHMLELNAGLNFVDDSILFFKGKKIYRANNDGIKNIMTVKNCDGIGGLNVLDGKIYIKIYAGSMHTIICIKEKSHTWRYNFSLLCG